MLFGLFEILMGGGDGFLKRRGDVFDCVVLGLHTP